jgi:hypothetical protein
LIFGLDLSYIPCGITLDKTFYLIFEIPYNELRQ